MLFGMGGFDAGDEGVDLIGCGVLVVIERMDVAPSGIKPSVSQPFLNGYTLNRRVYVSITKRDGVGLMHRLVIHCPFDILKCGRDSRLRGRSR